MCNACPALASRRALNRIQSSIFDKAFSTNENILVCAPTGAGKTNIAMLTVLHEMAANMSDGLIQVSADDESDKLVASLATHIPSTAFAACDQSATHHASTSS